MAKGTVREAMHRIRGAFSKLGIRPSPVEILINLAPAALEKGGTWLDLPIAIIMLQAAGLLPDLSDEQESRFIFLVSWASMES
jgi:magnesium chelatase family protein